MPPGTRTSLYENAEYQAAAPFAKMTLDSINSADPMQPTVDPVPYTGVQFVAIPEFQGIATAVGQQFSAALAGTMSAADALAAAQGLTVSEMKAAGYNSAAALSDGAGQKIGRPHCLFQIKRWNTPTAFAGWFPCPHNIPALPQS